MIDDNELIKERGKTMQSFYEDGNTNKWEMEAKEDLGQKTVDEWAEKGKEKSQKR